MIYENIIARTQSLKVIAEYLPEAVTEHETNQVTDEKYIELLNNTINKIENKLISDNFITTNGELYEIIEDYFVTPLHEEITSESYKESFHGEDTLIDLLNHFDEIVENLGLESYIEEDGSITVLVTHWLMQDEFTVVNFVINEGDDFYTVTLPNTGYQYFWIPVSKGNLETFLMQDPINKED